MNALYIENVSDEFLPTFKELAKALNAKLSISKNADEAQKQDFIASVKKDIKAYENGELSCLSTAECEREMQGFMQDLSAKYAR